MNIKFLTAFLFALILLVSGNAFAQEKSGHPEKGSAMAEMKQSPHHRLMMAYRHNLMTFANSLRDSVKETGTVDKDFASEAISELRRSSNAMKRIHAEHMAKMSPEMRSEMAAGMGEMKMKQEKLEAAIQKLEESITKDQISAEDVQKNAQEIISMLDMGMKMKMKKH